MSTDVTTLALPGPAAEAERVDSIDVLRGFAVLGILVMNIQSYAMVGSAYLNPNAYGDLTGANYTVWLLSHVLADMKFMTLFSLLFGAGVILLSSRREAATGKSAGLHYRRMGWLLLFGLLHAYLIWYGDILYTYALCGMVVYLFRRRGPVTLVVVGLVLVGVGSATSLLAHWSMPHWPPESIRAIEQGWNPSPQMMAKEIAAFRGGWLEQLPYRARAAVFFQTFLFVTEFVWRVSGLMLIGMGLFKLGVFGAKRSTTTYVVFVALAVLVGVPIVLYGVRRNDALHWDLRSCFFLGSQFNYWGSLLIALGWIGLIMLLCKHQLARPLTGALAAVGRMAFTNYISQSLLCTLIFYGHGLGLFGKVERTGQMGIVFVIFVFQLFVSPIWLRAFRFGPLEWLWRSLTYWRAQPMRRIAVG